MSRIRVMTTEKLREAYLLRSEGMSIYNIGKKINVSGQLVSKYIGKAFYATSNEIDETSVIALAKAGWTDLDMLARECKTTRERVVEIIEEYLETQSREK